MPPNRPPWAHWDYAPRAAGRLRSDWSHLRTYKASNAARSNASNATSDKHSSSLGWAKPLMWYDNSRAVPDACAALEPLAENPGSLTGPGSRPFCFGR